ncbi:MAG: ZPR1 zinc finger domain-containing protein [Candidatus Woesearchaeota archaeon]
MEGYETNVLEGQECPVCHQKTCTLTETNRKIPFGEKEVLVHLFSMTCNNCKYHTSDLEFEEKNEPVKYTLEVNSEEDLKIRIVKSAEATIKIPHIITIESGPQSQGYITNVEGLFNRVKHIIEQARDNAEDEEDRKKAKNLLKKIQNILWGREKQKIIIEDPTGNSAIISEKAIKSRL